MSAGALTCATENSEFDCVQIDANTVRWNVIGNPYYNGNLTGQFSVQNPNAPVYLMAHWHYAAWNSIYGVQTNPNGYFGLVDALGRYVNDGGTGSTCSHNSGQICGNYPTGTWNFTQLAAADATGKVTVGFQETANPAATVFWTPQEAYIIVSSVGYGGTPGAPLPTYTPASASTLTSTPTAILLPTWTPTVTSVPTFTPTPTPTLTATSTPPPNEFGSGTCWSSWNSWGGYDAEYSIDRVSIPEALGWDASIHAAAQTWTDVTPSHFVFYYSPDSENLVSFGEMQDPNHGAETYERDDIFDYFQNITERDTVINHDVDWDTNNVPSEGNPNTNGSTTTANIQNIMTHEFGHWLDLDDIDDPQSCASITMWHETTFGDISRITLEDADKDAINWQYP